MKHIVMGGIGLLSGAVLAGLTLVAASVYSLYISQSGWDTRYGVFGTALRDIGIFPLIISIGLAAGGFYFFVKGLKE